MRKYQLAGCFAIVILGTFLVLVVTGGTAEGQNTSNILNLPGTDPHPVQTPAPPGGLPLIDFSTNPEETTQPGLLPVPGPSPSALPMTEWKKWSLPEHFNYNPLKQGVIDYPAGWVVNFDAPAQTVTFLEDASGLVGWSLITLRFITTTRAEDFTGMLLQSLQGQVAQLQILEQEFEDRPSATLANTLDHIGTVKLRGDAGGVTIFLLLSLSVSPVPGGGLGGAILSWAPESVYAEKYQLFFGRMADAYLQSTVGR